MLGPGAGVTLQWSGTLSKGVINIPDRFMLYRNWVKLRRDEPRGSNADISS